MSASIAKSVLMPLSPPKSRPASRAGAGTTPRILFISNHPTTHSCAVALATILKVDVELAINRRAGLAALRHREYTLILVEEEFAAMDPEGCDLLWQHAGLALPLEVNLSRSSCRRVVRDVSAALSRRQREHTLSRRAAAALLESELKSSLAGLLLQSELALQEPAIPAKLLSRLRQVAALAGDLRKRLQPAR